MHSSSAGLTGVVEAELDREGDLPFCAAWQAARRAFQLGAEQTDASLRAIQIEIDQLHAEQEKRETERQELEPGRGQEYAALVDGGWSAPRSRAAACSDSSRLQAEAQQAEQRLESLQPANRPSRACEMRNPACREAKGPSGRRNHRREIQLAEQLAALRQQLEQSAQSWQTMLAGTPLSETAACAAQALMPSRNCVRRGRRRLNRPRRSCRPGGSG